MLRGGQCSNHDDMDMSNRQFSYIISANIANQANTDNLEDYHVHINYSGEIVNVFCFVLEQMTLSDAM